MTSKLAEMQARFQQKQMQEKEERLVKLYENQQQRAFERVSRGSAGSVESTTGGGKVRQMFDERRQKAGVDKSYPLDPIPTKQTHRRKVVSKTVVVQNGKSGASVRRAVQSIYNNNNGDESYEERRFNDNNVERFFNRDVVEMMNKHNLSDNLDDEELPQIGFDEVDEPYVKGKLANVGGKLPSQNHVSSGRKANVNMPAGRKVAAAPQPRNPPSSASSNSRSNSVPSSPMRSVPAKTRQPIKVTTTTPTTRKVQSTPVGSKVAAKNTETKFPVKKTNPNDGLVACKLCERRFAADRLSTHEKICKKTSTKKRKEFDATKHRLAGTDFEGFSGKPARATNLKVIKAPPKKDWRVTHNEFIEAIRAAKKTQAHLAKGGKLSDLPPPPPSSNPDYVQCPHCSRKFNQGAAERHIPKCSSFQHNKPKGGNVKTGKSTVRK